MNTAAFVSFLRHILFLCLIVKFANGVIAIFTVKTCEKMFKENEYIPLNTRVPRHAIFITLDSFSILLNSFGFVIIIVSTIGFLGAACLYTRPVINFTVCLAFSCILPAEFITAKITSKLVDTLDVIVVGSMKDVFGPSNELNTTALKILGYEQSLWVSHNAPVENGWSVVVGGDSFHHSVVDYIQINLKCCGLHGRQFWKTRIPSSCCPPEFQDADCILSVASVVSCISNYDHYRSHIKSLEIFFVCFGFVTIVTIGVTFYLYYLELKYPGGDYKSDTSSDSDEEEQEDKF